MIRKQVRGYLRLELWKLMMRHIKRKHVKITAICVVTILIAVPIVFYVVRTFPRYKGAYSIADYEYGIEIGSYEYEKKYDDVEHYWNAYSIAKTEISERFPNGSFSPFDIEYKREIYYDSQSDTWLVYVYPESLNKNIMILDGGYCCIVSSDGTVIACWRD